MAFLNRLGWCAAALLRSLDIVICTVWQVALYPAGLADRPTGRVPISAYVGQAQFNAMPWGIRAAAVIDGLARRLGDRPGHCRRAFLFYRPLIDPPNPAVLGEPQAPMEAAAAAIAAQSKG